MNIIKTNINPIYLSVNLFKKKYPIIIGENIIYNYKLFSKYIISNTIVLITDNNICSIYLEKFSKLFYKYKKKIIKIIIQSGELQKNKKNLFKIIDIFFLNKFKKDTILISLGGGVIGDLSGLCASLYMRGIFLIQIPTTLLSQVDSSIGGKNGINYKVGKNMIGTFYQPELVIIDISFLQTLSSREFFSGLVEIIKYAIIFDNIFFKWLEKNILKLIYRNKNCLIYAILNSCKIKSKIVSKDELEKKNIRVILNFGHTFGHAIESYFKYKKFLHGEAIANGIIMAIDLSFRLGYINILIKNRLYFLIKKANLFIVNNFNSIKILNFMKVDKKNKIKKINCILLNRIGESFLCKVNDKILLKVINNFFKLK